MSDRMFTAENIKRFPFWSGTARNGRAADGLPGLAEKFVTWDAAIAQIVSQGLVMPAVFVDKATLKAESELVDEMLYGIEDVGFYQYNAESTAVADDETILEATIGGRLLKVAWAGDQTKNNTQTTASTADEMVMVQDGATGRKVKATTITKTALAAAIGKATAAAVAADLADTTSDAKNLALVGVGPTLAAAMELDGTAGKEKRLDVVLAGILNAVQNPTILITSLRGFTGRATPGTIAFPGMKVDTNLAGIVNLTTGANVPDGEFTAGVDVLNQVSDTDYSLVHFLVGVVVTPGA